MCVCVPVWVRKWFSCCCTREKCQHQRQAHGSERVIITDRESWCHWITICWLRHEGHPSLTQKGHLWRNEKCWAISMTTEQTPLADEDWNVFKGNLSKDDSIKFTKVKYYCQSHSLIYALGGTAKSFMSQLMLLLAFCKVCQPIKLSAVLQVQAA